MLTPYQFASNTPIWAVDLDGLEARIYNDLSRLPHTFISVVDDEGIIHVYTFGQYGQKGEGFKLGPAFNSGSALVHLVGKDANDYINYEFEHYNMSVWELNSPKVSPEKIIDYYSEEMKKFPYPAQDQSTNAKVHATFFVNEANGSQAVNYKPYWLLPTGCNNENCTSLVYDGLRATGSRVWIMPIPWEFDRVLSERSVWDNSIIKVTEQEKQAARDNQNSQSMKTIILPEITVTPKLDDETR